MLTEMVKVRIIGLKAAFPKTLEALYSYGKIQFEDLRPIIESGDLPIESMELPEGGEEQKEQLVDLMQRVRAVCQGLFDDDTCHAPEGKNNTLLTISADELIERATALLDEVEPTIADLVERRKALEEELAELEKYKPIVEKVAPIVRELTDYDLENLDSVALLIEKKYEAVFETLEATLQEISDRRTKVVTAEPDDGIIPAIVVFDKKYSKQVRGFLKEEKTNQVKLPEEFEDVPLTEALAQMETNEAELPAKIDDAKVALIDYGNSKVDDVARIKDAIHDRIEEYEVIVQFGETKYTFLIEGYVPRRDFEQLQETVDAVGSKVVIEEKPLVPNDYPNVPVEIEPKRGMLDNYRAALGLWGSPQYGQFDPTTVLAISFPFIFGMIVGDAGYGLLTVLLCVFLRKKYPNVLGVQNITGVLMPAGIMTIIFGIFYFEFFGNLAHIYIPPFNQMHPIHITDSFTLPFLRTETEMMTTLLFMALGFGVLEVMIGLVLGVVNGKKSGHPKHMFEKGGILIILFSALLLAVTILIPNLADTLGTTGALVLQYAAYLLLAIGFVSTVFGGGIMGVVETLESVTHAASYIRIMAVGLVGALLADAANELAFHTMPNIGGVVIAIVLHVLNFAIILFSPSIHALRLSFLEFFGKFFERGNKEYRPFARAGKEGK